MGRILLVLPNHAGERTGNEVSAQRLLRGLRARGIAVDVVRPEESDHAAVARLRATPPSVIHGFHARRTGPRALTLATKLGAPLVLTLTGTDVDVDVHDPDRVSVMAPALGRARVILAPHARCREALAGAGVGDTPLLTFPKGVEVPEAEGGPVPVPGETRPAPDVAEPHAAGSAPLVLQVAHVRRVKNNLLAAEAVRTLREGGTPVRLRILGGVRDEAYAADLRAALDPAERHLVGQEVARERMADWYAAATVVLNTSHGEGGSNAVLEAMARGRAVLASAIPGNLEYLGTGGERGLAYPVRALDGGHVEHDLGELVRLLERMLHDRDLRTRLGEAARAHVAAHHRPEDELARVLEAYRSAVAS